MSKTKEFGQRIAMTNARFAAQGLQQNSPTLRDLITRNDLKIVAAVHPVAIGHRTIPE
jgi:carbonic anhydrase